MKKSILAFVGSFFIVCFAIAQDPPDNDKDGVPDSEDLCPSIAGTKANKGCPANGSENTASLNGELTEQGKKILITNFQKILLHIPTKFEKLKTGEEDWDITNRISRYSSTLLLFPNHTDKNETQLMYGTYNGKPLSAFIEKAPADVNTIVTILLPVLKAKGMLEVNTKFVMDDPAARSFRSKDAVLQINTGTVAGSSVLNIGKLPYYYENDVKPIANIKPNQLNKPVSTSFPLKKYQSPIEPYVFEDLMASICDNSVHLKIKGNNHPLDMVVYETRFPMNGYLRNLPVYYTQTHKLRFSTIIGLSDNVNDLDKAAEYINNLLAKTNACQQAYRTFKLKLDGATGKYTDVSAWDDGGMFVYVEKEAGKIQMRVYKINYSEEEKKKTNKPAPFVNANPCSEMETILQECVRGFSSVKGSFVKKETPAEYYTTTLPSLGFKDKYVVESKNIEISNGNIGSKKVTYYSAEQDFSNKEEAIKMYEDMKARLKNCFSGTANVTNDTNQKIYELFTQYKGYTIRIAVIYLNFFSSSVSISFKISD